MDHPGVQFVFAPALYPQSPLSNHTVFLHGEIVESKSRTTELTLRVKDEKGEWEAYVEGTPDAFQKGDMVRAYGLIVPQPDGKMMLAAKWVKKIPIEEWEYCIRQTQTEWLTILEKNPSLMNVKPFVLTQTKPVKTDTPPKNTSTDDEDFVSAHQLKVEKEYL